MFGKANCLVLKLKNPMTHHALVFSRKHRACLRLATLFSFAGLSLGMANAQTAGASSAANAYPAGPVTLLVPFTTGTGADLMARLLGPKLADKWKVSVVTDNKAGASGSIGTGSRKASQLPWCCSLVEVPAGVLPNACLSCRRVKKSDR